MAHASSRDELTTFKPTHLWLKQVHIAFVPGPLPPMLEGVAKGLLKHLEKRGHIVQEEPDNNTDVILTSAPFGESLGWRKALLFTARFKYKLEKSPTIFTLIQITPDRFAELLEDLPTSIVVPKQQALAEEQHILQERQKS